MIAASPPRTFAGSVRYRVTDPSTSRFELTIPTENLQVLTPDDPAEIRQVTAAMRGDVLHVDRYPEIRVAVTRAARTRSGVRLDGELTLVGRTRPIHVDASVKVGPDTLRARGTFAVNQSDFGIEPYRGGPGGTVRVADRVTFVFDAVAVREPVRAAVRTTPPRADRASEATRVGRKEGGL